MQRQSLGGSPSRLSLNGVTEKPNPEEKPKALVSTDEEESKLTKPYNRSSFRIEKSIHLIPILTLFCFLVLYLCSHDPSQSDMMSFSVYKSSKTKLDSTGIEELERFPAIKTGSILAIRSLRSLQEVEKSQKSPTEAKKYRLHRKLGDF